MTSNHDLVIRGGKLVDGTGNPWVYGDIAIRGDRIVAVGKVPAGTVKREIDAKGLVVAPGFIDMHSHSDTLLLEDGSAPSKVRQGVTTEVLGEGSSAGPYIGATRADGRYRFETLGGYLAAVEKSLEQMDGSALVHKPVIGRAVTEISRAGMRLANHLPPLKRHLTAALQDERGVTRGNNERAA